MTLPVDGSHLSDLSVDDMLDQYGGEVESQFTNASIMRQYVKIRPIRGTDTIVNNRVGKTTLQKLTAGVRPDGVATPFGKVALTVDTVVLARDNRSMLNEFQTHFNARMELAEDHGKEIGKFFDQAFIIQAIKGAGQNAPSGLNGSIGAGKSETLDNANDELDANKLSAAIETILVDMEEDEVPIEEMVVFVRPAQYKALSKDEELMTKEWSDGNGDYAKGRIETIHGARIVKTTRIPTAVNSSHFLSNEANGNAYNVDATEARTVAVIMHPRSLLAGETIPLTSDIWFNREEKQWFIDSFLSFAVTVNRPDLCGRVLKAA